MKRLFCLIAILFALSASAHAQPQLTTITGTIYRPGGGACANCTFNLTRVRKGGVVVASRPVAVTSNGAGAVSFTALRSSLTTFQGDIAIGNYNFRLGVEMHIPDVASITLETLESGEDALLSMLGGGAAGITSIALALPNIFTVSGSPLTSNGTITATLATQTANKFLGSASSGGAATPAFRVLATADIPDLSAIYSPVAHVHTFASLTSKPTTLAGYGIVDAAALVHTHAIADTTGLQAALDGKSDVAHVHTFASLTSKPTTLSGYGITDGQPVDADLTAIAALSSDGLLRKTSGTWAMDSATYLTGNQTITLSGNVTGSGTTAITTTIANSAVTNAMLAGSIALSKLSITGTPDGTKYLRDDGSWQTVAGGGGMAIGGSVTSATAGRVLFVGSGPVLADDAGLTFDGTTNTLTAESLWAYDGANSLFKINPTGFLGRATPSHAAFNRLVNYYGDGDGNLTFWSYNAYHSGGFIQDTGTTGSIVMLMGGYSGGGPGLAFSTLTARGYRFSGNDGTSIFGTSTDAELGAAGASQVLVRATVNTRVGLSVQGAASQSANLLELQNSSAAVVAAVGPGGNINASGFISATGAASDATVGASANLSVAGGTAYFQGYNFSGAAPIPVILTGSTVKVAGGSSVVLATPKVGFDFFSGFLSPTELMDAYTAPSTTNALIDFVGLRADSTGTPAAGFGISTNYYLKSSTTNGQPSGRIANFWTDATHASRSSAFVLSLVHNAGALTEVFRVTSSGVILQPYTYTAAATTGAQTISKASGSVNFAAAATSLVVTNSLVTANSIIICTVSTNDTTMKSVAVVPASGSFTIHANAAATAETRVAFWILNQ